MKKALIIVDVQNNYFSGGCCELYHPVETAENIQKVLERFRKDQNPIIFIQHRFQVENGSKDKEWYDQIHDIVKPKENEVVLQKVVPNSFHDTGLEELLQSLHITDLVIVGMMSHMCIDTTVRAPFLVL
ncbi:MAG: isochorismatase family protein [Clostridiales bacterium]|nr:isochorismatase family protein [Clostridiales bacterium]